MNSETKIRALRSWLDEKPLHRIGCGIWIASATEPTAGRCTKMASRAHEHMAGVEIKIGHPHVNQLALGLSYTFPRRQTSSRSNQFRYETTITL
jgi:hypothetical protein